jgi:hypothetical protein
MTAALVTPWKGSARFTRGAPLVNLVVLVGLFLAADLLRTKNLRTSTLLSSTKRCAGGATKSRSGRAFRSTSMAELRRSG